MNAGYRAAWGAPTSVLSNRGVGIEAEKCLCEGVIVPISLYGAEARGMRCAERREGKVRLDRWCERGFGQQKDDNGGCASMRERSKKVESPGTYVTE